MVPLVYIALNIWGPDLGLFYFRPWERLHVIDAKEIPQAAKYFPGAFYPDTKIVTSEVGDLGHHTPFAAKRYVTWETDRYGNRIADAQAENPEVVIVGDSLVIGSGIDQRSTLAAVLHDQYGYRAYPLAPASICDFLQTERFRAHKPADVVLISMEGYAQYLKPCVEPAPPTPTVGPPGLADRLMRGFWVAYDQYEKKPLTNWLSARLFDEKMQIYPALDGSMLFFQGEKENAPKPQAAVDRVVRVGVNYRDLVRTFGSRFAYVVVPNKETVYWDLVPGKRRPTFLSQILAGFRREGVTTVDLAAVYAAARSRYRDLLYLSDDTHWNHLGVALAAQEIVRVLQPHR